MGTPCRSGAARRARHLRRQRPGGRQDLHAGVVEPGPVAPRLEGRRDDVADDAGRLDVGELPLQAAAHLDADLAVLPRPPPAGRRCPWPWCRASRPRRPASSRSSIASPSRLGDHQVLELDRLAALPLVGRPAERLQPLRARLGERRPAWSTTGPVRAGTPPVGAEPASSAARRSGWATRAPLELDLRGGLGAGRGLELRLRLLLEEEGVGRGWSGRP